MRIYSISELKQFEGYDVLKHVFNDGEIQVFYNTPKAQRGQLLTNRSVVSKSAPKPAPQRNTLTLTAPPKRGTQMCTDEVNVYNVMEMAKEVINRTFEYNNNSYNLVSRGWALEVIDTKRSLGICFGRGKKVIGLSRYFIENYEATMKDWEEIMLHEIAHAIDKAIRGHSAHDWKWRNIALAIGSNGERTSNLKPKQVDLLKNPISKYTLVCECGYMGPSHKRHASHRKYSCPKCAPGYYSPNHILKQVQNY